MFAVQYKLCKGGFTGNEVKKMLTTSSFVKKVVVVFMGMNDVMKVSSSFSLLYFYVAF